MQSLTRTGEVFGSPFYMSPEHHLENACDHHSDIYSLGCALFETLTGTPPFVGDSAVSILLNQQNEVIPTLAEASMGLQFPVDLEDIIASLLAKNPQNRYQSMLSVNQAPQVCQRWKTNR